MKNILTLLAFAVLLVVTSGAISAAEFGTRDEAKAMLDRAVAVLKADKRRALDLFTSGHGGFINKDLYVFCGGPDDMLSAHPYFMGANIKGFKDSVGKAIGEEIHAVANEDTIVEVTYKFARPGEQEDRDKVSLVTQVGDQICGVGYYK